MSHCIILNVIITNYILLNIGKFMFHSFYSEWVCFILCSNYYKSRGVGGGYVCFNSVYLVSFNVHKYTWTGNFFTVKLTSKHNNEYNEDKTSETGRSDMGQNKTIKLFRAIYKSIKRTTQKLLLPPECVSRLRSH